MLPLWLKADIRAAVVGIVVGGIVGKITTAAIVSEPIEHFVKTSSDGFSQPLVGLAGQIGAFGETTVIRFEPQEIRETYVCESAYLRGGSYREIFLRYVDRYPSCFDLSQESQDEFVVRPNRLSGVMSVADGEWRCKCRASKSSTEQN